MPCRWHCRCLCRCHCRRLLFFALANGVVVALIATDVYILVSDLCISFFLYFLQVVVCCIAVCCLVLCCGALHCRVLRIVPSVVLFRLVLWLPCLVVLWLSCLVAVLVSSWSRRVVCCCCCVFLCCGVLCCLSCVA